MRLITEQRQSTRIPFHHHIQWQRISQEECHRWHPAFLQHSTRERQGTIIGSTEIPAFLGEGARPIEVAILQSLKQLHNKLDRLLESVGAQRSAALQQTGDGVDLSASGMRFAAEQEISREQNLLLSFGLPDARSRTGSGASWGQQTNRIEVLAKAVNIVRERQRWTVAVAFVAIHPRDQQAIQEYCQAHRHQ